MGRRISYSIPKYSSSLSELVDNDFADFRKWFLKTNRESIEEYNESIGSAHFINTLEKTESFNQLWEGGQQKVDELVLEFLGTYCDWGEGRKLIRPIGPDFSTWRYSASDKLIQKHMDEDSRRLWGYLFTGRSLIDDNKFIPDEDRFRIGYWKPQESSHFLLAIRNTLGSLDEIQEKFWTKKEKRNYEQALRAPNKQGYVGISNHNPVSSGIEYVLQTLEELSGNHVDLIFATE
ncbi:MAG: hypothetical protein AAF944_11015 [Bacteroidota bacterium]